jgi:predicted nucleic acid-binding protein
MITLLDNTVLSNFAIIARPDWIRVALGDAAATVEETFAELQRGIALSRLPNADWTWLPVLHLDDSERVVFERLRERLNAGEAACLSMASARNYRVFTDDRDARAIALQMQIPISGTLGLLLILVRKNYLSLEQANVALAQMIAAGYHSPSPDLRDLNS